MKLHRKKNRWDCLLNSIAMALDCEPQVLRVAVGHDGSQCVDPSACGPVLGRRGFHIQEFIPHILKLGKTITPFEVLPASLINGTTYRLPLSTSRIAAFVDLIATTRGVLTGVTTKGGTGHAVTYERSLVYDPDKPWPYPFSFTSCHHYNFIPQCGWIIQ